MFIARNLYKFLEIYHAARNLPIQPGKFILTDHHQPARIQRALRGITEQPHSQHNARWRARTGQRPATEEDRHQQQANAGPNWPDGAAG